MITRMDPYAQPYEKFRGMGRVAGPSAAERRQQQQASGTSDLLRMLAGAAPYVGTAIGAGIGGLAGGGALSAPGALVGGSIGGSLGQAAGGVAQAGADMVERPTFEKQAERDRQIELLLKAFSR
jgi:hypothetical protein